MLLAKKLLDGSSHTPEIMEALGDAFDRAWVVIVLRYLSLPGTELDDLQIRLAQALLSNAEHYGTDVDALVDASLSGFI